MSKGIKRVLVIAVVAVALIAATTSIAFAWWDSTKDSIEITTANSASNVILSVTTDSTFTNNVKLVPKNSFTDTTHATSICIGAFTPVITSEGTASEAIAKTDLTYSIDVFKVNNVDQKTTGNFVVTINAVKENGNNGIAVNTGKLTSSTKYYIHIAFADGISADNAKTFDAKAIELKIKVTASSKSAA